jgi:hypothetical protein
MSDKEFKDKFIGFVDILGWKEMVKAVEAGVGERGCSRTTSLPLWIDSLVIGSSLVISAPPFLFQEKAE